MSKVPFSIAIGAKATKLGGYLGKFLKFFKKKNFGRSAEISASRDPLILVIFFEIWA